MNDYKERLTKHIEELIANELAAANKKFPAFASTHEGWAVLQEEFEEAGEEIEHLDFKIENLWTWIKDNQPIGQLEDFVADIRECAIKGIEELIQVAAMCDKFMAIGKKPGEDHIKDIQDYSEALLKRGDEVSKTLKQVELARFNKNNLSQKISNRCKGCKDYYHAGDNKQICLNPKNQKTTTEAEWTCPEWHDA